MTPSAPWKSKTHPLDQGPRSSRSPWEKLVWSIWETRASWTVLSGPCTVLQSSRTPFWIVLRSMFLVPSNRKSWSMNSFLNYHAYLMLEWTQQKWWRPGYETHLLAYPRRGFRCLLPCLCTRRFQIGWMTVTSKTPRSSQSKLALGVFSAFKVVLDWGLVFCLRANIGFYLVDSKTRVRYLRMHYPHSAALWLTKSNVGPVQLSPPRR